MDLAPRDLDDVPRLLRKALGKRLKAAGAALRQRSREAIHTARKELKKARAIVRLLRPTIGERRFRKANRALRDAARPLGATRDADVMVAALDGLRRPPAGLRRALVARGRRVRRESLGDDADETLATLRRAGRRVRRRAKGWSPDPDGWRSVRGPLVDAYGAGRDALARARSRPADDEAWHECRKRAKDLRYHLELLTPIAPDAIGRRAEAFKRLTDLLGDDHDLAVLRGLVTGELASSGGAAICDRLDARRKRLKDEARRLGTTVFAAPPEAFARELHACWRAFARS